MDKKTIEKLIIAVAKLQVDVEWVKKYVYISVTSSVTAAIAALSPIIYKLLTAVLHITP